jgi:hypothetical protein
MKPARVWAALSWTGLCLARLAASLVCCLPRLGSLTGLGDRLLGAFLPLVILFVGGVGLSFCAMVGWVIADRAERREPLCPNCGYLLR